MASSLTDDASPKRADKRKSINILVLGDEAVGKSSLISTFVSRRFAEAVPGIMTRIRLPPDPETTCTTTIIDSQGGDAGLAAALAAKKTDKPSSSSANNAASMLSESLAALLERAESSLLQSQATTATMSSLSSSSAGVESVDSIVLVYDLDREETFYRLQSHWLPLIEQCYQGKVPVIIAENKVDLFRPTIMNTGMTEEQALARKRQQIVSMMQQFPFVRQCIKCSAKNLLRMDDVFLKAQQAVLYPFTPPLYDLENGRLTADCKRVLTRIFRMYDFDRDGLLSDAELDRFQRDTYQVPVFDQNFVAWKKIVVRNNTTGEEVLDDGKFTLAGFLTIFDVFITQNRLDVVWQALRKFGYDDDLNLHIPESITSQPSDGSISTWKLTPHTKRYLTVLFHQFDRDKDGILAPEELLEIFSVVSPPSLPPWHPSRSRSLFKDCFSIPRDVSLRKVSDDSVNYSDSLIVPGSMSQTISQSGISLLTAGDSLPTINMGGVYLEPKPMTYLEWMGYWHTICSISASVTKAELYRLGYVEPKKSSSGHIRGRKKIANLPRDTLPDASLDSRTIRVLVLGSQSSGKTALLNGLCGMNDGADLTTSSKSSTGTNYPESCCASVKIKKQAHGKNVKSTDSSGTDLLTNLVFTDVPETAAANHGKHLQDLSELFGSATSPKDRVCDLAVLVFDGTKSSSLAYVKELESSLLTSDTPRLFVTTKADLFEKPEKDKNTANASTVLTSAKIHCQHEELEEPLVTSAADGSLSDQSKRENVLRHIARCALDEPGVQRLKSKPFEEKEKRDATRRRKMLWLGGFVTVGVVVAVGYLLGSVPSKKKGTAQWFRSFMELDWWRRV